MIDWESAATHIFLNPRTPEADAQRIRRLIEAIPPLEGHLWLTTSGATGRLKPVALSKGAVLASAAAVNQHLHSAVSDVWLKVLPTFHVGGLGIHARAHLSGASVETLSEWSVERFAAALDSTHATLSALVPTQVFDLVRAGCRASQSVRAVVVGGGPLSPALYREARTLGWPLLPSYGCTECASQAATATLRSLDETAFPKLERLTHISIRTDANGRLELKGPSLFTGYAGSTGLEDPKREGWFQTEDLAHLAGDMVEAIGRDQDVVKVGGEIVSTVRLQEMLEAACLDLGFSGDATLIALPDLRLGSVIQLVMVGEGISGVQLQKAFNRRVLPFERVREVHKVDAIPRSALGKVMRDELVRMIGGPGDRRTAGPGR